MGKIDKIGTLDGALKVVNLGICLGLPIRVNVLMYSQRERGCISRTNPIKAKMR
jgi:hypothetical protein